MEVNKNIHITTQDFANSKEEFNIIYDESFNCLKTFPTPSYQEIEKYYNHESYISHNDNQDGFVNKLYQSVKNITLNVKYKLLLKYSKNGTCNLDYGGGTGSFAKYIQNKGLLSQVYEPSKKARKIGEQKKLEYLDSLSILNDEQFDTITLWHVLEHIENLDEVILKFNSLLKTNGVLFIAVPNYKSFDAKYYNKYWAAYDVPRHIWHFSKESITSIFETRGFKLIDCKPMWFDSFYVAILSEKYKNNKNNLIKAFFVGLYSNLKGIFSKEFSSHIYILRKT